MNKQPEVTEQTRKNIEEAFFELYASRPIHSITVKEIAAKAGYNRGTFYEYFRDVHECLESLERRCLPEFDQLPPVGEPGAPPPEVVASVTALYREKLRYYEVLLGENGDPAFQRKLIDGIKSMILSARRMDEPNREQLPEMDLTLEYVLSGMVGVMRHHFRERPGASVEDTMAMMYRIMQSDSMDKLRAIATSREP